MMMRYLPRWMLVKLIGFYQRTFSFDHGIFRALFPYGYCRFHPTCSEYAKQAISKHGAIKGGIKAAWRILRCNPFNKGGFDPVEKERQQK